MVDNCLNWILLRVMVMVDIAGVDVTTNNAIFDFKAHTLHIWFIVISLSSNQKGFLYEKIRL